MPSRKPRHGTLRRAGRRCDLGGCGARRTCRKSSTWCIGCIKTSKRVEEELLKKRKSRRLIRRTVAGLVLVGTGVPGAALSWLVSRQPESEDKARLSVLAAVPLSLAANCLLPQQSVGRTMETAGDVLRLGSGWRLWRQRLSADVCRRLTPLAPYSGWLQRHSRGALTRI